jgi:hypothetical protein
MSNEKIILKPTAEVLSLCEYTNLLISTALESESLIKSPIGRFESEQTYRGFFKLLIRQLESITVLAQHDLVLAPSANNTARTIFETSIKSRWMFIPIDPYEREIRWLTLIRSQKERQKKLLTHLKKLFSCIRRILFKKSLKHKVFELGMNLVR